MGKTINNQGDIVFQRNGYIMNEWGLNYQTQHGHHTKTAYHMNTNSMRELITKWSREKWRTCANNVHVIIMYWQWSNWQHTVVYMRLQTKVNFAIGHREKKNFNFFCISEILLIVLLKQVCYLILFSNIYQYLP